jgi:hypothetical protein
LFFQYGLLKKVTSSDQDEIPGYVLEELMQLSYSSEILASQLATYLADSLITSSSVQSKLKTSKCIHHLTRQGSRQFRHNITNYSLSTPYTQ